MGFRCGFCGQAQPSGTKPTLIVTQIRMINRQPLQQTDTKTKMVSVISRERYETVKEKPACPNCTKKEGLKPPEVVEVLDESSKTSVAGRRKHSRLIYYIHSLLLLFLLSSPLQLPQLFF